MKNKITIIFFGYIALLSCARDITKITIANAHIPNNYNPGTVHTIINNTDDVSCTLFAKSFSQGNIVYFEIVTAKNVENVTFDNKNIPVSKRRWGYRGFFALAPDLKPGMYSFSVTVDTTNTYTIPIVVSKTKFLVSTIPMDLGKYSKKEYLETPEVQEFIKLSTEKKKKAFATSFDSLIRGRAYHPRDIHEINSSFWAKRIYKLYDNATGSTKTVERIHRGIDLNGNIGDPVYAMLDGIVVLSEMLFYEGNMIIINHGNGIFSYYMHLSELLVKSGDRVVAGQLIGKVGSTGMSTGPHLHVSLIVNGIQVNPMSLLSLPIRE